MEGLRVFPDRCALAVRPRGWTWRFEPFPQLRVEGAWDGLAGHRRVAPPNGSAPGGSPRTGPPRRPASAPPGAGGGGSPGRLPRPPRAGSVDPPPGAAPAAEHAGCGGAQVLERADLARRAARPADLPPQPDHPDVHPNPEPRWDHRLHHRVGGG